MKEQDEQFVVDLTVQVIELISTVSDAIEDKKINIWEVFQIGREGKDVFQMFKGFSGFELEHVTDNEIFNVSKLIKSKIESEKVSQSQVYYALNWIKYTALSIGEAVKK